MKAVNVNTPASGSNDNAASSSNNDEVNTVAERTSKISIMPTANMPESVKTSNKNGK